MERRRIVLLGSEYDWPRERPGQREFRRPHFAAAYAGAWDATAKAGQLASVAKKALSDSNAAEFETASAAALALLACADRLVLTLEAGLSGDNEASQAAAKAVEYYHFAGNNFSRLTQFERSAEFYLSSGLVGIALARRVRPSSPVMGPSGVFGLAQRSLLRARTYFRQAGDDASAEWAWVESFELQRRQTSRWSPKRAGLELWRLFSRYGTQITFAGVLMVVTAWAGFAGLRYYLGPEGAPLSAAAMDSALSLLTLDELAGDSVPSAVRFANAIIGLVFTGLLVQLVFQKLSARG